MLTAIGKEGRGDRACLLVGDGQDRLACEGEAVQGGLEDRVVVRLLGVGRICKSERDYDFLQAKLRRVTLGERGRTVGQRVKGTSPSA